MRHVVRSGTKLYRAREAGRDPISDPIKIQAALGPAPGDKAKNNRMSPHGIGYMYCSEDIDTCLLEIRAKVGSRYLVGEFTLVEDMEIIDLTFTPFITRLSIFSNRYEHELRWAPKFVSDFTKEISKPISDLDAPIEYVPTQLMAEYVRHSGHSGIRFESSLNAGHHNVALFLMSDFSGSEYFTSIPEEIKFTKKMYLSGFNEVVVGQTVTEASRMRFTSDHFASLLNPPEPEF